jgi:cysteine desulfurase
MRIKYNFVLMKKVYLDNASTTQMRPEVIEEMIANMNTVYGNPSSNHSFGRLAKSSLELSRKKIAQYLNCSSSEIIFTSGGTESNNWVLQTAITTLKIERIITSKIEHHAVLHTIEKLEIKNKIAVVYVNILPDGTLDRNHLEELLKSKSITLVSLMHVNNEIGTILDLKKVSALCQQNGAFFHSDTVQSVGKCILDLQETPLDFLVASAHKFHGPKGVGFVYIRKGLPVDSMIYGGEQEKGLRAGTESVANIVGMAKALEMGYQELEKEMLHISEIKEYTLDRILKVFPNAKPNSNPTTSFYNILNIQFPFPEEKTQMILFYLDMKGVAVSRGSACQSGSVKPSHVLEQLLPDTEIKKPSLRISFSHFTTKEDIDFFIESLQTI